MSEIPLLVLPDSADEAANANLIKLIEVTMGSYEVDTLRVSLNGVTSCVLTHPRDVQRMMTAPEFAQKGDTYDGVRDVIGDSVLTTDGADWRRSHSLVADPFHRTEVAKTVDLIAEVGGAYIADLRERVGTGAIIDLKREMTELTFDTITAVLFGEHAQTVRDALSYGDLQATFEAASKNRAKLTGAEAAEIEAVKDRLTALMQQVVGAARVSEPSGSLLSKLAHHKEGEAYLDDKTIRDELITLLFAGHETAALTLTWLFELTKNRQEDIVDVMRAEVDTVLGGAMPTMETVPRLTYINQVISEVLRLRPPAPITVRQVKGGATIRGTTIEPNQRVLAFIWGLHRHPDFWQSPEEFDPDRFSPQRIQEIDRWAYLPFAAGQRVCLGKHLALTELAIHTALLLQAFNVQVIDDGETGLRAGITLNPDRQIRAYVEPR
jgi:cytochrome P450